MRLLLFVLAATFLPVAVHAAVAPEAWDAMKEREVVIEKTDGSEVTGKLVGVAPDKVTVMKADGRIVVVEKSEVAQLRGVASTPVATPAPIATPASPPRHRLRLQHDRSRARVAA